MIEAPIAYPGLLRVGRTLIISGVVGYGGFLALDLLLPAKVPQELREDRFRLSSAPTLHTQPKSPAYLELSDGAVPARIPNFGSIEPEEVRRRLLSLKPGTDVVVLRPAEASVWLNAFDILALRVGDSPVLTVESTVSAHAAKAAGSRAVTLYLAALGLLLLAVRKLLARRHDAA